MDQIDNQLTRRNLFCGSGALLVTSVGATAAAGAAPDNGGLTADDDFLAVIASADAALLAACARMRDAQAAIDRLPDPATDEHINRVGGLFNDAVREITALPAVTEAGVRAKAAAAHTALMSQVHTFEGMDWRDEATMFETLALVTLHEIAGRT